MHLSTSNRRDSWVKAGFPYHQSCCSPVSILTPKLSFAHSNNHKSFCANLNHKSITVFITQPMQMNLFDPIIIILTKWMQAFKVHAFHRTAHARNRLGIITINGKENAVIRNSKQWCYQSVLPLPYSLIKASLLTLPFHHSSCRSYRINVLSREYKNKIITDSLSSP